MKQYMLSLYQPDGDPPPAEVLEPIMTGLAALRDEMVAAGSWVTAVGLYPPSTATVVRANAAGSPLILDGPFTEGKEHVGGFTIIAADDLDVALVWARKLSETSTLPVEVRPIHSL